MKATTIRLDDETKKYLDDIKEFLEWQQSNLKKEYPGLKLPELTNTYVIQTAISMAHEKLKNAE